MRKFLHHPQRNALILGLLQGVPQGLKFKEQELFFGPGLNEASLALILCLGLLAPPIFAVLGHFTLGRRRQTLVKISKYVDLWSMMFWGGLSLGTLGLLLLRGSGSSEGSDICVVFIAAGTGFLGAGFVDRWLTRAAANAT